MKNSPSGVHVLYRTLNLVISRCCFAEEGIEMYRNVKRTCRAIVSPHETYCFATLSLSSQSSLLKFRSACSGYLSIASIIKNSAWMATLFIGLPVVFALASLKFKTFET